MALTKPAGCAIQLIGTLFILVGVFGTLSACADPKALAWAAPCLVIGVVLLWVSRYPSGKRATASLKERRSSRTKGPTTDYTDLWVEETLSDRDGYYYRVRRGHTINYVDQAIPGDWKTLMGDLYVAGTQHHKIASQRFLGARAPWLKLERDPENKHDPNAVKVIATWVENGEHVNEHIGFVPRDAAAELAEEVPEDTAWWARLSHYGPSKRHSGAAEIHFDIMQPARTCPHCGGDIGRTPRKPGNCESCGKAFAMTPKLKVIVPA